LLDAVQVIVDEILAKRGELTSNQILELIEQKKKEGRGLLSDEGAARLVAEELLIQTHGAAIGRLQVKNIVSGLNDVTLSGRVLLAWPPQQFQRRDGSLGRVMRVILADRSGKARCALWDRHVDIAGRVSNLQGRIIRIGHAYTRQGLTGEAEVHAGDRSSVEIDPPDLPLSDFPEFKELFSTIGNLRPQDNSVNVVGIVQVEPRVYTFAKDERKGNVLRTSIGDASGTVPLVVWNEKAEELLGLKIGDTLQIINCRMRANKNGRPEVHVESRSQVSKLDTPPDYLKPPAPEKYKIGTIRNNASAIDISVFVLVKGTTQEVKRSASETVKLTTLLVGDDTGIMSLSLWDDKAEIKIDEGDFLQLRNATLTEWAGYLRLNLGRSGTVAKVPESRLIPPITMLDSLQSTKGLVILEGSLADSPTIRQVKTERESNVNVASFMLSDNMTSVRVTLWREHALFASTLHAGQRIRLTGVRAQPGLDGQPEVNSIQLTKIDVIGPPQEGATD